MKVAFFGYDFFHSILDCITEEGHTVDWIFTYPVDNYRYEFNKKILNFAGKHRTVISMSAPNSSDIERIIEEGCDLIIVAAYEFVLPIVENMPLAVNFHPADLPEGRGAWPLPYMILRKFKRSALTVHKISNKFDQGDIILKEYIEISSLENYETLSFKFKIAARKAMKKFLRQVSENNIIFTPQGKGSYWQLPSTELRTINWNDKCNVIARLSRAFGKMECYAIINKEFYKIQDLSVWEELHDYDIGSVVIDSNLELVVACKDGFVCLRTYEKRQIQATTDNYGN